VRVWGEKHGDCVRLWVEDKGIGIPTAAQERLFHMFQRATNDYQGTGVGLAIVRKVVHRMGGSVGVESEEGKGSRFWVELPAATV
jgi:signal transduction histidine kinase